MVISNIDSLIPNTKNCCTRLLNIFVRVRNTIRKIR